MTDASKVKTKKEIILELQEYFFYVNGQLQFYNKLSKDAQQELNEKVYPLADHEQLERAFRSSCTEIVDLREELNALKDNIHNEAVLALQLHMESLARARLSKIKGLCEERK